MPEISQWAHEFQFIGLNIQKYQQNFQPGTVSQRHKNSSSKFKTFFYCHKCSQCLYEELKYFFKKTFIRSVNLGVMNHTILISSNYIDLIHATILCSY